MKLKIKVPAFALSLFIVATSFLMAIPQKVSALDNEGVSVSDCVTEKAQEVSDVKEEADPSKEKPEKTIGEKEFEDLYIKMNDKFAKDYAKKAIVMQVIVALCFISGICKDMAMLNFIAIGVGNILTLIL